MREKEKNEEVDLHCAGIHVTREMEKERDMREARGRLICSILQKYNTSAFSSCLYLQKCHRHIMVISTVQIFLINSFILISYTRSRSHMIRSIE